MPTHAGRERWIELEPKPLALIGERDAARAALLATQFCPQRRHEENAYITALFQNLGTMLAWMHFPAEASEVEARLAECDTPDHGALQTVSRQVLGMGYEDLCVEILKLARLKAVSTP